MKKEESYCKIAWVMPLKWQIVVFSGFILIFLLAAGCHDSSSSGTAERTALSGQKIFRQYCVNCHGARGNLGLNGAGDLTQSELGLESRIEIIRHGKNTMTAFSTVLSDKEIQKVATYTLELNDSL